MLDIIIYYCLIGLAYEITWCIATNSSSYPKYIGLVTRYLDSIGMADEEKNKYMRSPMIVIAFYYVALKNTLLYAFIWPLSVFYVASASIEKKHD